MSKTFTGGCLCEKVRWTLHADEMPWVSMCHCLFCQKSTGSAFSTGTLVQAENLKIEGELKEYSYQGGSGKTMTLYNCFQCGSTLFSTSPNFPGMRVLKIGTFDEEYKSQLPNAVKIEVFCGRRLPFLEPGKVEEAMRFDGAPGDLRVLDRQDEN